MKLSTDADYVFDGVVRDGVTCAAAKNDQRFLELLAKSNYSGKLAVDSDILLGRVAEHYARGIPTEHIGRLLVMLSEGSPVLSAPVVAGLSRGWPKDKTVQLDEATKKCSSRSLANCRAIAGVVTLANRLGNAQLGSMTTQLATALEAELKDEKADEEKRLAAAGELIDLVPMIWPWPAACST